MDYKKIGIYLYKIRYSLYVSLFLFVLYLAFNDISFKKERLYDEISSYKNEVFLIQNGKKKTKTLTQAYIKNLFSKYHVNLDYVENKNGTYYLKASNVNLPALGNIIYDIENDGFDILYLKAQDYSGKFDFIIHMEIR